MKGYEWVEAVLAHSRADPYARLVLVALASRANAVGECWPSQPDLITRTRLSWREVRYATRRLEGLGELETRPGRGRGHTTLYRLTGALAAGSASEGASTERRHGVPLSAARKPARHDQKTGTARPENRHRVPPEPDRNLPRTGARARALQTQGRARAEPDPTPPREPVRLLDLYQEALARLRPPASLDAKA